MGGESRGMEDGVGGEGREEGVDKSALLYMMY